MMADRLKVDVGYWQTRKELKRLLNEPLPGGRGAQAAQDKAIYLLAKELARYDLPNREFGG